MSGKIDSDIDEDEPKLEDEQESSKTETGKRSTPSVPKRNLVWRCACGKEFGKFSPQLTKHIKDSRDDGDGQLHQMALYDADTGELLAHSPPEARAKGLIGSHKKPTSPSNPSGKNQYTGNSTVSSPVVGKFIAGTVEMSEIPLVLYRMTKDAIESRIDTKTGQHMVFTPSVGQWIEQCLFIVYTEHAEELGLSDAIVKRILEVGNVGREDNN